MVRAILLAFLAFAGPLQAQLVYACSAAEGMEGMEGMVASCCYDHDGALVSPDCDADAATAVSSCMELGVEDEADQSARNQPPSDRDHTRHLPPATGPPAADPLPAPVAQPARGAVHDAVPDLPGSDTYLLTLRLRI